MPPVVDQVNALEHAEPDQPVDAHWLPSQPLTVEMLRRPVESTLYDAASVVLRRANAIGRVLTDEFRPVGLTGRFSDETGQQHQVALADSAEVRSRAFVAVATQGGSAAGTSTPPPPSPGYVQLAEAHPDVAEVLYILGRAGPAPGWMELSKVFEIISDTPRAASSGAGSPGTKSACSEAQPIATRSAANLPAMPA